MNETARKTGGRSLQIVVFSLGREEFGLRIDEVQEIVRIPSITRLPRTQKFVKGIINLRGGIIPVIDMRERFGFETGTYTDRTRIIVVRTGDRQTGLIVDDVSQVLELGEENLEPAPEIIRSVSRDFMEGILRNSESMIILLRTGSVVATDDPADASPEFVTQSTSSQGGKT